MGPSMLPTINMTGDILAVNRVAKRWGQLNTGDVVLMRSPENPRKHIAKRIFGVEGDTVTYLVDPANSDASKTVVVCHCAYDYCCQTSISLGLIGQI
jgi:mitochondrial inner membrane protease subunit 1